jgi:Rer1 family
VCCAFNGTSFITCVGAHFPSIDAHAIYILNLLLAFLQPKFDPSLEADLAADTIEEGGDAELDETRRGGSVDEEFRPFVRRLPEWNFWCVPHNGGPNDSC